MSQSAACLPRGVWPHDCAPTSFAPATKPNTQGGALAYAFAAKPKRAASLCVAATLPAEH
eukprot:8234058-Heterocapsa_arctica.AAC.1